METRDYQPTGYVDLDYIGEYKLLEALAGWHTPESDAAMLARLFEQADLVIASYEAICSPARARS